MSIKHSFNIRVTCGEDASVPGEDDGAAVLVRGQLVEGSLDLALKEMCVVFEELKEARQEALVTHSHMSKLMAFFLSGRLR